MSRVGVESAARSFSGMLGSSKPVGRKISGTQDKGWVDACLNGRGKRRAPVLARPRSSSGHHRFPPTISPRILGRNFEDASDLEEFLRRSKGRVAKKTTDTSPKHRMNRDYVFVLDTSGSISNSAFTKAKKSLIKLAKSFCPITMGGNSDHGTKQMAVVLFSDIIEGYISFSESRKGIASFTHKMNSLTHRNGRSTKTALALQYVAKNVLRKGASRLGQSNTSTDIIVITDGRCNRQCRTLPEDADLLREMGANVFAFGIDNARSCELKIISGLTGGFNSVSFNQFDKFADEMGNIAKAEGCA